MNEHANKLGLTQSFFDSPHGLQNIENLSTAHDIAKLSAIAIKNECLKKIVMC